jgi:hypothetical protein
MVKEVRAWTNELSIHTKVQLFMAALTVMLVFFFVLQPQVNGLQPPTILATPSSIPLTTPVSEQKAYPLTSVTTEYKGTKRQTINNTTSPIAAQVGTSPTPIQPMQTIENPPIVSPIISADLGMATPIVDLDASIGLSTTSPAKQENNCTQLLILKICTK